MSRNLTRLPSGGPESLLRPVSPGSDLGVRRRRSVSHWARVSPQPVRPEHEAVNSEEQCCDDEAYHQSMFGCNGLSANQCIFRVIDKLVLAPVQDIYSNWAFTMLFVWKVRHILKYGNGIRLKASFSAITYVVLRLNNFQRNTFTSIN